MRRTWLPYLLSALALVMLAIVAAFVTSTPVIAKSPTATLVKNAENPDKQEIYRSSFREHDFELNDGDYVVSHCTDKVPDAKRLVIEHIGIFTEALSDQKTVISFTIHRDTGSTMVGIPPLTPQGEFVRGLTWAKADLSLVLRLDAGEQFCAQFGRMTASDSSLDGHAQGEVDIQGYMIDMP